MDPIAVGFVGAGGYGRMQLEFLNMMGEFTVKAVCDVNSEQKVEVDKILSNPFRFYTDYSHMLEQEKLDTVFITTPNHCHEAQVLAAIEHGLAVYLEKPPSTTIAGCRKILAKAEQAGAHVMVGMQLRYGADYQKAKAIIDSGEIGKVKLLFHKEFRKPFLPGYQDWRLSKNDSGGSIMEKNVHQFDLFTWYAESVPVRVSGMGSNQVIYGDKDILDHYSIMVEYENGVEAVITESLFSPGMDDENHFYILGDKGVIIMVDGGLRIKKHGDSSFEFISSEQAFSDMGHGGTEYNAYLSFAEYVRGGKRPYTCLAEGMSSVLLSVAAEMAIAEKRVVELQELITSI